MAETFTFDNTLSTDLAKVRLAIGDFWSGTTPRNPLLSDETINALISSSASLQAAKIAAIDAILTIFAREADTRSAASMSIGFNSRYESFRQVKRDLEATQGGTTPTEEYAAGASYAERAANEADTDWIRRPDFYRRAAQDRDL